MPGFDHSVLTDVGWDALADALSGKQLTFVHMEAGSGTITGGDAQMQGMTSLVNKVMNFPITSFSDDGKGQVTLIGTLSSKNNPGAPFQFSEIGVKATVAGGPELLYTVAYNSTPDTIPDSGSGAMVIESVQIVVKIDRTITPVINITAGDVTAQNIGVDAVGPGWFRDKIGSILNFKRLTSPTATIKLADKGDTVTVDADVTKVAPTGTIWEYAGTIPPSGWLLADGSLRNTVDYPDLFNVCGYRFGGSGAQFALPDYRGRVSIGAGQGPGLTNRVVGQYGGEEATALSIATLPAHAHTATQPNHSHQISDPGHAHSVAFSDPGHAHSIADNGHAHSISDPMHYHNINGRGNGASGTALNIPDSVTNNIVSSTRNTNTGIGIYPSGTGIGIYNAGTGIGVGIYNAGTGIQIQAASAGAITVASSGGGQAHNTMQPFIVINKIIKI